MLKDEIKNYLIITFVVVEILSMLFNFYFVKVAIGSFEYELNFSVVFFCIGFFIVDVVADQYSPLEAKKFIYYKFFSLSMFMMLGQLAVNVYGLEGSQIAKAVNKSPWMVFSALISTYGGIYVMTSIMSRMKIGIYQGSSVFKRYLYSTIPGEVFFSFVFTFLCFYRHTTFDDLMHFFVTSSIIKIILAFPFALIMSVLVKIRLAEDPFNKQMVKVEIS